MKKMYLSILSIALTGLSAQAQQLSSDDPSFQTNTNTELIQVPVQSSNAEQSVASNVYVCAGAVDSLEASGSCYYSWSTDSLGANVISTSATLNIGPFSADTTFYLGTSTTNLNSSTAAPLPAQTGTFSGNVRGYYFTAPADFTITGLYVPTDASSGNQNVAILLFDNQTPPPVYSGTTNAFTTLGYWPSYNPNDTIEVCIPVTAGDVIGIYGSRNDINSYAGAPYTSSIAGIATTFTRSGMQLPLSTNAMTDVYSEVSGSISRVEFFYDTVTPGGVINPVNINIVNPSSSSATATICSGGSIFLGGALQNTSGVYIDSLTNQGGCDSIITTTLTVHPSPFNTVMADICQGDSILLGGVYQTSSGSFIDVFQSIHGCDSTVNTVLSVNALPTLSLSGDTMCLLAGAVALNGTPTGGVYSGTGVSGTTFDPSTAGAGVHTVTYTYSDTNGCSNQTLADFNVQNCAGLEENTLSGVKIYPNPAVDYVKVELPADMQEGVATLYDVNGRIIFTRELNQNISTVETSDLLAGVYIIEVKSNSNQKAKFRLIKK